MSADAPEPGRSETTELLLAFDPENPESLDRILPVIYGELRQMAHRHLAKSGASTLRTTALVHEAYLKLVDDTRVSTNGRAYFFGAAARAMRQVLVDRARRRNAKKRGSGERHLDIDDIELGTDDFAGELLDLDAAMTRLSEISKRQSRVIECRFFGGLSVKETATALGVSERTVKTDWAVARAWLYRELTLD
ncbi:MAG: ECF-type sigma factor [Rhodothermales bacterium]